MSTTYTAWNGEERVWPPPENWYRAADGRWWHPAFGPGDKPDLPDGPHAGSDPVVDPEPADETNPESSPPSEPDPQPVSPSTNETATRRSGRGPVVVAALVAAVVVGIAVVASIVGGDSTSDRDPASPAIDEEPPTSADADIDPAIADFRLVMTEHDLSTTELSDEQIIRFASTYCDHAAGAADRVAFDALLSKAITETDSSLTSTQLDLMIITAVTAFCPAESARLGLGEDQVDS